MLRQILGAKAAEAVDTADSPRARELRAGAEIPQEAASVRHGRKNVRPSRPFRLFPAILTQDMF